MAPVTYQELLLNTTPEETKRVDKLQQAIVDALPLAADGTPDYSVLSNTIADAINSLCNGGAWHPDENGRLMLARLLTKRFLPKTVNPIGSAILAGLMQTQVSGHLMRALGVLGE